MNRAARWALGVIADLVLLPAATLVIAGEPDRSGTLRPDAIAYGPELPRIYTPGLAGRMTLVNQISADNCNAAEAVALHFNAHTLTIDPAPHRLSCRLYGVSVPHVDHGLRSAVLVRGS